MTVNQTTPDLQPVVASYVELVRLYLGDLDDEVREELSGGLEADLLDLVADRGPGALPDPEEYADELRLAAGLPPRAVPRSDPPAGTGALGLVRSAAAQLRSLLDEARTRWLAWAGSGPREPAWSFVTALQPVWWVTRGWVAWMVLQDFRGPWVTYSTPQLAALALAVVGSVQLGRRRWRLGELLDRRLTARLLLVALNVFAVTMVPGAVDRTLWHAAEAPGLDVLRLRPGRHRQGHLPGSAVLLASGLRLRRQPRARRAGGGSAGLRPAAAQQPVLRPVARFGGRSRR